MAEHGQTRSTARIGEDGVVLFLIGMRVNKPWRVDKWVAASMAMIRMLRYLGSHPEAGLIRARNWFGRTTMQVGYWRSVDDLIAFAAERDAPHAPAWRWFNRVVGKSGAVGVWHETYIVRPGAAEAVYVNMPPFGLADATEEVPVGPDTHTARRRLGLAKQGRAGTMESAVATDRTSGGHAAATVS